MDDDRVLRSLGALAAGVALLTVMVGCGNEVSEGTTENMQALEWDLSEGHTTDDVEWPSDTTAFQVTGGVDVVLHLPDDHVYEDHVEQVMGLRHDAVIDQLNMSYPATSTEDAYELAQELGEEWDIDLVNIDDWYERRMRQREQGEEDYSDTAFTGGVHAEPVGGPEGPAPVIEMFNTFNPDRPVSVQFSFVWRRS